MKTILQIISAILKVVLEFFAREGKKQKEVKTIGRDEELQADIDKTIEDQLIPKAIFICPKCGSERVEEAVSQVPWICTECDGLHFMYEKGKGDMKRCKKCGDFAIGLDGSCASCGETS